MNIDWWKDLNGLYCCIDSTGDCKYAMHKWQKTTRINRSQDHTACLTFKRLGTLPNTYPIIFLPSLLLLSILLLFVSTSNLPNNFLILHLPHVFSLLSVPALLLCYQPHSILCTQSCILCHSMHYYDLVLTFPCLMKATLSLRWKWEICALIASPRYHCRRPKHVSIRKV